MIDVNESISKIEIDKGIIEKLKSFDIVLINDLIKLKRKSLKELNLNASEIKQIIIKLELIGFDLNKK